MREELIVCRMSLSIVLPHFEVFCKGFFSPPNGGIILGGHFGLSTFGVHLNGMLAARSSGKEAVAEFPVIDLGFQGRFSAGLGTDLSFCLPSISPFHIGDHAVVRIMCISCYHHLRPSTDWKMSDWSKQ
jgi:hypothetical protein